MCILLPLATSQLFWSIGESAYYAIYGRMSSESMAAMSIINPLQCITMALFAGFSTAAGIIVGNHLGKKDNEKAYQSSRKFLKYSVVFSILVAMILLSISSLYPKLYNVPVHVAKDADSLIDVFAIFTPVKVCMSVVSMFTRSGGKTKYMAIVDFIGTFLIGIPIGVLAAFVWNLPIQTVYFLISLEELTRFIISLFIWRSKNWIQDITEETSQKVSETANK